MGDLILILAVFALVFWGICGLLFDVRDSFDELEKEVNNENNQDKRL